MKIARFFGSSSLDDIRSPALRVCLALAVAAGVCACSDQNARFAGIWKSNCSDYWGVQISPVDGGLYTVTFCGLSGCMPPGQWMPDSRIKDDPMYQVVSSTELRIKHKGQGYFLYTRCSAEPQWSAGPAAIRK